jgi:hypothetical protein
MTRARSRSRTRMRTMTRATRRWSLPLLALLSLLPPLHLLPLPLRLH